MERRSLTSSLKARRAIVRRAFSLLEVLAVVVLIGFLSLAGGTMLGNTSLANVGAEGLARKISLALVHARRSTIATGDNHYLQMTPSGANVSSYAMFRKTGGGDVQTDTTCTVPTDVTVTSNSDTPEFDFEGAALGSYTITVAGPDRGWSISVALLTGAVQVAEIP